MKKLMALCLTFTLALSLVTCSMKQEMTEQEKEQQQQIEKSHAELEKFLDERPAEYEKEREERIKLEAITIKDIKEQAKAHPYNKYYYASGESLDIHSLAELTTDYQSYTIDGEKVEVRLELARGERQSSTYSFPKSLTFLKDIQGTMKMKYKLPPFIIEKLNKELLQGELIELGDDTRVVIGFQLMNHARKSMDKFMDFYVNFYPFFYSIRYQGTTYQVVKKIGKDQADGIIEMNMDEADPGQ